MENRNKQWGQAPSSSESNDQWKRHDGQYGGYHRQWGELHGQHSQNQQWYTSTGSTQNRHMHWNGHPQNQQGEPSWQMNQYPGVANGAQVPPGGFHYPPVDHQSNRVIQIFTCYFFASYYLQASFGEMWSSYNPCTRSSHVAKGQKVVDWDKQVDQVFMEELEKMAKH